MPRPLHAAGAFAPAVVHRMLDAALDAARAGRPFALAGLQGSGKSTLAAQLVEAAAASGLRAVAMSLDDAYLDRPDRLRLAREVHPLLATRGPPGTHDVGLACDVLDDLLAARPVRLPRFDKLADARLPESAWTRVDGCDLVIVEGWCLRVSAQPDEALERPINALERDEDADGTWRRWCNAALARDYPALWSRLPELAFLAPPGFDVIAHWRWQQECTLRRAATARAGMSRAQVERFVQHFERVSRHALDVIPPLAAHVLHLDARRRVDARDFAAPASTTGSAA
jgi:D-glycerate 3-kinase